MRTCMLSLFFSLLLFCVPVAGQGDAWKQRTFSAPPEEVFQAARVAIALQHHQPKLLDEKTYSIEFHVNITAWSWGYDMTLHIEPTNSGGSVVTAEISKSGGSAVSWGSGKKEVRKIYDGIEAVLKKRDRVKVDGKS